MKIRILELKTTIDGYELPLECREVMEKGNPNQKVGFDTDLNLYFITSEKGKYITYISTKRKK